jgi:hypothetical protein
MSTAATCNLLKEMENDTKHQYMEVTYVKGRREDSKYTTSDPTLD